MDQKGSREGSHEEILFQGKRGNEGRPEKQENPTGDRGSQTCAHRREPELDGQCAGERSGVGAYGGEMEKEGQRTKMPRT